MNEHNKGDRVRYHIIHKDLEELGMLPNSSNLSDLEGTGTIEMVLSSGGLAVKDDIDGQIVFIHSPKHATRVTDEQ